MISDYFEEVVKEFQKNNIRVSIFVSPSINTLENLEVIEPNRVELYTFDYVTGDLISTKDLTLSNDEDILS